MRHLAAVKRYLVRCLKWLEPYTPYGFQGKIRYPVNVTP